MASRAAPTFEARAQPLLHFVPCFELLLFCITTHHVRMASEMEQRDGPCWSPGKAAAVEAVGGVCGRRWASGGCSSSCCDQSHSRNLVCSSQAGSSEKKRAVQGWAPSGAAGRHSRETLESGQVRRYGSGIPVHVSGIRRQGDQWRQKVGPRRPLRHAAACIMMIGAGSVNCRVCCATRALNVVLRLCASAPRPSRAPNPTPALAAAANGGAGGGIAASGWPAAGASSAERSGSSCAAGGGRPAAAPRRAGMPG